MVISIWFTDGEANQKIKNSYFYLIPEFQSNGVIKWKCDNKLAGGEDMPMKYLPSSCR